MTAGAFGQALAQFDATVDELLRADVSGLEGRELIAVLESFEITRRRLEAVDQRLLVQAHDAHLATSIGQHGMAAVLGTVLRVDPREATRRVERATDLGPRRTLAGGPLEPVLPVLAEAVREGAVSAEQADVICQAVEHVPPCAPADAWPVVEKLLVEAARHEAPRALRRTAAELLARLDPDGIEPVEDKLERQRGFTLIKNADGSSTPRGKWTAALTAHWESIFDSLAVPQPAGDDGTPDPRSASQRRHDALLEAARRLMRSGTLPASGGVPVTVLATTTMAELVGTLDLGDDVPEMLAANSSGLALLGNGQTISARYLLAMACEAQIVPVVFNDAGGILAYGRTRRLASADQRLALAARDGGCCFPGCDRPAAWTEVHHVKEWIKGGATDVANMCLLCVHHHHSFEQNGWEIVMRDGTPWWLPPPWLDPDRTPIRNTTHHRPEIVFREPGAA